jgi:hypothetical protein
MNSDQGIVGYSAMEPDWSSGVGLRLPMKIIHRRGHNCALVSSNIRFGADSPILTSAATRQRNDRKGATNAAGRQRS